MQLQSPSQSSLWHLLTRRPPRWPAAAHGSEQFLAGGDLRAPELVRVDAANALCRLELARKPPASEANAAYEDVLQLNIELQPFEPFAERIWELRHAVTSYDAWYVAVAEALGMPLATLDGRLVRANGPRCRFITAAGFQQPGRPAATAD